MIDELDGAGAREIIGTEPRNVLVDFWSPWCAPCRALRPHLDRLSQERETTWRFIAVNTERHPDAAAAFGVTLLPTIAFFRGGEEVERLAGGALPSTVDAKLDAIPALRGLPVTP